MENGMTVSMCDHLSSASGEMSQPLSVIILTFWLMIVFLSCS